MSETCTLTLSDSKQLKPPTESNATAANTTPSASSQESKLKVNLKLPDTAAPSGIEARPASTTSQSHPNNDRRRKLSSRDYLLIKLAANTASLSYLAKRFGVTRECVRDILARKQGFCSTCNKWKPQGEIVLSDDSQDIEWLCDDCLEQK